MSTASTGISSTICHYNVIVTVDDLHNVYHTLRLRVSEKVLTELHDIRLFYIACHPRGRILYD